jgi:release factor glutamine methyltransferase
VTTLRQEIAGATASLEEVGCESPRLDAELLLAYVLGVDRAQLVVRANEEARGDVRTRYLALLTRRVKREPIAYILGRKDFRHLTLAVDPRVLIPRPETELLVEVGLTLPQGTRVADIGTGSGAVALALKQERPDLELTGSDLSEAALALARENAGRLGLEVRWVHSDLLADVEDEFEAVLANPPYVAEGERAGLAPEITRHEPPGALFAGEDGLDLVRRLLLQLAGRERVATVALEIGAGQAEEVEREMRSAGFAHTEARRDLAGIERVVLGKRGR